MLTNQALIWWPLQYQECCFHETHFNRHLQVTLNGSKDILLFFCVLVGLHLTCIIMKLILSTMISWKLCFMCSYVALMMGPELLFSKLYHNHALCPLTLFYLEYVKEEEGWLRNTMPSTFWYFCCNCYLGLWYMESCYYRCRNSRTGGYQYPVLSFSACVFLITWCNRSFCNRTILSVLVRWTTQYMQLEYYPNTLEYNTNNLFFHKCVGDYHCLLKLFQKTKITHYFLFKSWRARTQHLI